MVRYSPLKQDTNLGIVSHMLLERTGKDLMWYARDTKQTAAEAAQSAREEIERVKEEEEAAMRVIRCKKCTV